MAIEKRLVPDRHGDLELEGFVTTEAGTGPRPAVLMFPNFLGLDATDDENAERIVGLGYAAVGCDLYGKGNRPKGREEAVGFMNPLRENRALLQERMLQILDTAKEQPEVDSSKMAAIGFCFGGLCALDLARTGADIRGVASFHGLFDPPGNTEEAPIRARVAAYHGWADPMVPPEQVVALGEELTRAGCDWQIHAYGGAVHGFTHHLPPQEGSIQFNALAAQRSWKSLADFLAECFA